MRSSPNYRHVPPGYKQYIDLPQHGAVAYFKVGERGVSGLAFAGKRNRPDFHFLFKTEERLARYTAEWIDGLKQRAALKAKEQEQRKSAQRGLEVGDVVATSWGYEQTNVEFYEVTALVGKRMVEIRRIAAHIVETNYMQGNAAPKPGEYLGKPIRVVARNGSVSVDGHHANKLEPTVGPGGVKVWPSRHWSSYA